jgi:hypothetical protein
MEHLPATNVPVYETRTEGREVWQQCADRELPVVAIRNGERGYIVRYDLQHLDRQLSETALRQLRDRVRSRRAYETRVDPYSETEGVGGETGHVAGEIHAETETRARQLASHISWFMFDETNLT